MNSAKTAIIVLAAGEARRMGQAKQMMKYRGKTMLQWVIENVIELEVPVFVVLGANADQISPSMAGYPVEVVVNSNWIRGMGTSIGKGVEQASVLIKDLQGVTITLADQPAISSHHLMALKTSGAKFNRPVVTRYQGVLGVPAYFPRHYFNKLTRLEGDQGARTLIKDNAEEIQELPFDSAAIDIDTREDWQEFINRLPDIDNSGN